MNNNRLPPLNSLKAFDAAARHESFLEAAAEQSVTPGSISRHVRLLERYLGTELFVRRSNGVTLPSAGKEYAGKVSGILRDPKVWQPVSVRSVLRSNRPELQIAFRPLRYKLCYSAPAGKEVRNGCYLKRIRYPRCGQAP